MKSTEAQNDDGDEPVTQSENIEATTLNEEKNEENIAENIYKPSEITEESDVKPKKTVQLKIASDASEDIIFREEPPPVDNKASSSASKPCVSLFDDDDEDDDEIFKFSSAIQTKKLSIPSESLK